MGNVCWLSDLSVRFNLVEIFDIDVFFDRAFRCRVCLRIGGDSSSWLWRHGMMRDGTCYRCRGVSTCHRYGFEMI